MDLNATLGKGWVEAEGDQIALRVEPGLRVDIERFHAALAQVAGHSHPPHRLCDACLAHLAEAAGLYTADFLVGFTLEDAAGFDDWQTFQTESLRLELAGALERLAQGLAGRQDFGPAITHARRWLALDPVHEPAHRLLMKLHAWAGDRAAAARQYQECVKVMQAELGIDPEPETTALLEAIRGGTAGEPAPNLPFSPSPTLLHNLPADPTPFIGRETELAQVAGRLADPACRLLTVLGPGGMGKTRLAIQAARGQTEVFAHGVFFVDLAAVASTDFLAAAIVRALPIPASGADAAGSTRGIPARQASLARAGQLRAPPGGHRAAAEAPGRRAKTQVARHVAPPAESARGVAGAAGGAGGAGEPGSRRREGAAPRCGRRPRSAKGTKRGARIFAFRGLRDSS